MKTLKNTFTSIMTAGSLMAFASVPSHAVVIDFTGGTAFFNDGGTGTTNNSSVFQNVSHYEEDGFRFQFSFSTPTPATFASIIGDYYGTGNDVVHWHWDEGAFGEVTEVRVTKIDGANFDLGGFRVSTNTSVGGGFSTGTEAVSINTSKGTSIFNITPDNWGLGSGPDPLITISAANTLFDDISWFSFTNDSLSTAVGMGLDNFFINEPGDDGGTDPTVGVPEPSILAMIAFALFGVGYRRRRSA